LLPPTFCQVATSLAGDVPSAWDEDSTLAELGFWPASLHVERKRRAAIAPLIGFTAGLLDSDRCEGNPDTARQIREVSLVATLIARGGACTQISSLFQAGKVRAIEKTHEMPRFTVVGYDKPRVS
jgi:hypothetical protein